MNALSAWNYLGMTLRELICARCDNEVCTLSCDSCLLLMFIVYPSRQFADERPPFAHENHADPGEISTELHDIPVSAPETLDNENVQVQLFLPGMPSIEASEVADIVSSLAPEVTSLYVTTWVRVGVNRARGLVRYRSFQHVLSASVCFHRVLDDAFRQFLLVSVRFQHLLYHVIV